MWLICGLEGANIVLGKFKTFDLSAEERGAVADQWFQGMYTRFLNMSARTDPSSRLDRQAIALCNKWRQTSQILLGPLLADIAEFIALSDREGGQKVFRFLERRGMRAFAVAVVETYRKLVNLPSEHELKTNDKAI